MSRRRDAYDRSPGPIGFARRHTLALLLALTWLSAYVVLLPVTPDGPVPAAWPAAGLVTGAALLRGPGERPRVLAAGGVLLVLALLLAGFDPLPAVGWGLASVAGCWVTLARLVRGLERTRPGLVEEGDVSRLISAASQGAAVAGLVAATTVALTTDRSPALALVAVWGTHAAAQLVLLPLFLEGPPFAPLAPRRERIIQSVLTLGVTVLVFSYASAPPLMFAVMPMFGWLAFRGTIREASVLLAGVGVVSTTATTLGLGPVQELGVRYGLAPELVVGFLQLFLIDCALILLPLSVMAAQQRMSAARARSREQTLQRLVDSATGTGVLAVDRDGRIELLNPGAEAILGRSAAEVGVGPADTLFDEAELGRQAARLGAPPVFVDVCAASVARDDERQLWHVRRPDGAQRTMLLTITGIQDDVGAVSGYLCVADDVTEREARHRSLVAALEHERAAVERLRDLERVKSDFVATVSHELRTPLTSMIGYVELLEDGMVGDLSEDQAAVAARVQRNGRRLLLLVEDLLLLSQIESRQMQMNPVRSDLRRSARAAYDAVGPLLATRQLETVVQLPDDPVIHEADPEQVERLVANLVSNGVKFTPDGGRVELAVSDRAEDVEIVVADNGIGIPAAEQDRLFTRFFRSSTATVEAIQGVGLGLTIVHAIVDRHGGRISVTSHEDVGTTVAVTLPKRLPDGPSAPVGQSATPYSRSPASPSPGTM